MAPCKAELHLVDYFKFLDIIQNRFPKRSLDFLSLTYLEQASLINVNLLIINSWLWTLYEFSLMTIFYDLKTSLFKS